MSTRYCVIMQGAPGSGKTWVAKILASVLSAQTYSTDTLRMVGDKYVFDPSQSQEKHEENQRLVETAMSTGINVIVDNTNIKRWEARPYVEMARRYGYVVRFVRCEGEYPNEHRVPEEQVKRMREGMELLTIEGCLSAERPQRLQAMKRG